MDKLPIIKEKYIEFINEVVTNKKVFHAYLIEITDYETDFKYILDFVKMIVSNVEYEKIDNSNIVNKKIYENNYSDLVIIEPEGNWIKKQQLLDLKSEFNNKSLYGNKRIYIIKNAEKLNGSSANTILKFLEEPEEGIIAILVTNNRYSVLDTILSRCQVLSIKNEEHIIEFDNNIDNFIKYLAEPKELFKNYSNILENIFIDKNNTISVLDNIKYLIINYFEYLSSGKKQLEEKYIKELKKIRKERLLLYLSIFEEEIPKLDYNVNFKLWMDSFFSKLINGSDISG